MNPLISVIVPVYKVEPYIDDCIQSIVDQTYENLEIILVDDGSPDRCPQMCDTWAEKDSRIIVIHKVNGGVSSARNAGLDTAKGDFIYFVDSDDYIDPKLCERIMNIFKSYNVEIVSFDCNLVDDTGKVFNYTEKIQNAVLNNKDALCELILGNINSYFCNKVFKSCIFDGIRCPVGRVWEDMAITYKLFLKAESIYTLPEKLYYYRQRENSIIHTINDNALCDIYIAQIERYECLKSIYPDIAELAFDKLPLSAIRLYDRSLWKNVDENVLEEAKEFLRINKDKILSLKDNRLYKLYFNHQKLYDVCRITKHRIGNIVKFLLALLHK